MVAGNSSSSSRVEAEEARSAESSVSSTAASTGDEDTRLTDEVPASSDTCESSCGGASDVSRSVGAGMAV